jgi:hypothetical protein
MSSGTTADALAHSASADVLAQFGLPDIVTVLRAKGGKLLTKRWTRVGGKLQEHSYDKAYHFTASEYIVNNVRELGELIKLISADPRAAVVRGAMLTVWTATICYGVRDRDEGSRQHSRQGRVGGSDSISTIFPARLGSTLSSILI